MGVEDALSTRAWPGLLALTLAACGGRYSGTPASDDTGGASSGGKPATPSGNAGRSSGSGGASTGGSGVSMGGVGVGVGGSLVGTAGMATGSGGVGIGGPSCQAYCESFAKVCPERNAYTCSKTCYSEQASSACPETLRQAYDCVTREVTAADSCNAAVAWASKVCGAVDGWPLDCDDAQCELSISGDPMGCHAVTTCGGLQAELHCTGSGPVVCSCWVDGRNMADLMTALPSSKAACGDSELQALCLSYARP